MLNVLAQSRCLNYKKVDVTSCPWSLSNRNIANCFEKWFSISPELVKPVLTDLSRDWKKCGLLTQVNYSEKCTFEGLKGRSLNTGGLKDRFNCTCLSFIQCNDTIKIWNEARSFPQNQIFCHSVLHHFATTPMSTISVCTLEFRQVNNYPYLPSFTMLGLPLHVLKHPALCLYLLLS